MNYAPALIIVYNRLNHFKQCIESLMRNIGADQTDLFIAIDAPYRQEDRNDVESIYAYSKSITGFKSITIFMRDKNLGPRENLLSAVTDIYTMHDEIILSEDDNIFSVDFLEYMNQSLSFYRSRKDIVAICGYNYPVTLPKEYRGDVFAWTGFSAWGYGIWKDRWYEIDREPPIQELKNFLHNKKINKELDAIAGIYKPHLENIINSGHYSDDTILCYNLFKNKKYCIFPTVSHVRNIGHDGSGIHCGNDIHGKFLNQQISDGTKTIKLEYDIEPDVTVNYTLYKYFKISKLAPIKRVVIRLIHYNLWRDRVKLRGRT